MSAQRRTSTKRDATATAVRPEPIAPAGKAAARSAPPAPRAAERTPDRTKAAAPGRGEAVSARTAGARRLFRDTMVEMRKINWPDQETTRNLTIVVIGISVVLGLALGGIDFALVKLLEALP